MKVPVVKGIIDRRILINFRVNPARLTAILPAPFEPKLVNGSGIAGVCLIRLRGIRPGWVPRVCGITSENAAHRVAVTWRSGGDIREGVYIPRRDTSCRLNAWLGGRLFPGIHHHARFEVDEEDGRFRIAIESDDGETHLVIEAQVAAALPESSVFGSLEEASEFFERGSLGYSATSTPGEYDGLELRSFDWKVEPLEIMRVESSFFDDKGRFPKGDVSFDDALLMRGIRHEWHGKDSLYGPCCTGDDAGDVAS